MWGTSLVARWGYPPWLDGVPLLAGWGYPLPRNVIIQTPVKTVPSLFLRNADGKKMVAKDNHADFVSYLFCAVFELLLTRL